MAIPTPAEIEEQRFIIYKADDGLWHARHPISGEWVNGMHRPITRHTSAEMADYLQYLSVPYRIENQA